MSKTDEILKQGYVDVKVAVAGLRQHHRLEIVYENIPQGKVPFLVCKHYIPAMEMLRLAEEFQLPIKHKDTIVFPKGKTKSSFTNIVIEPDTVEAELE